MTASDLGTAFRIALRELRGGLAGFRVLMLCLALGVTAIAAVGSVRAAIEAGLRTEANALLGGDAEVRFTYRTATADELDWLKANAARVSGIVDFRSMLAVRAETDARETALTQVKGVDSAYPLYGAVELDPAIPLADALAVREGLPGIVVEQILIDRMGLAIGDRLRLGTQDFELRAAITREPDGAVSGFMLGPRSIVLKTALDESGLLTPGTLYESSYRLAFAAGTDVGALKRQAEERFADSGLRWRDIRNGTPGLSTFVDRMGSFLVLVGLAGLAVGGVGVSAAVASYLDRKTETIATLKSLGATGGTIFAIYLIQIGAIALAGIAAGLALGWLLPLLAAPLVEGRLPVPARFGFYPAPLAEAALYGALTALIFTVWPLARARDLRAAALYRDVANRARALPRPGYVVLTGVLVLLLVGSSALFASVPRLALGTAGSISAALAVLALAALGARRLARRLARAGLAQGRPALRLALGAIGGPGGETASVVMSLGLGLAVLAGIGQIDTNLRTAITEEIPKDAPAYFFVDIQNDQLDGFRALAGGLDGVERIDTAPMLRGIITRINDRPARDVVGDHWVLRGDRGVTYAETIPPDQITLGEGWPADYAGEPLMSFAAEEAQEMGLKPGDRITVNILGRDLTARLASLREVEFENMGINFVMTLNPAALAGAPHTHISTVYAAPAAEAPLARAVADAMPNVTAIRVRDGIDRVTAALEGIGAATRYGAAATLLTGFVVLIGAAAAGERRRVFEAAVLKTLGATRARILSSFALRAAILGAVAGLVAIAAGGTGAWAVMRFVMDAPFAFEPVSALTIVTGGAVASLLAGLAFALRPLAARPARVLRSRD